MTPSQSHKFHQQGEQDLADRMLSMGEDERKCFDYFREGSPDPPFREDDEWVDVPNDAMDIDHVLNGTYPVNLSKYFTLPHAFRADPSRFRAESKQNCRNGRNLVGMKC